MDDVLIRPAHAADLDEIQSVAEAAWHETYDDLVGTETVERVLGKWYEDAAIEAGINHEQQDFFVAVDDETVIGYAHVGPHPPQRTYQLYRIYVHPDYWRRGVGKDLLANVEQELFERDAADYEAEVLRDNDAGVAFLEATGFERVQKREGDMVGTAVPEYRYRKPL